MARAVICLGVIAVGLVMAAPASAQETKSGYIPVSKLQIDPHMNMLSDGPGRPMPVPPNSMPMTPGGAPGGAAPLDQMGGDQDSDAPLGDDPVSDNAVQTDTVYTV